MFYFNSNNLCNGGEMVKKIGLIILMMIACIMPINANSISVELQDSVDELSKENVEFRVRIRYCSFCSPGKCESIAGRKICCVIPGLLSHHRNCLLIFLNY